MPNWTVNHITTNNPEIIPTFINKEGNFDFNKMNMKLIRQMNGTLI